MHYLSTQGLSPPGPVLEDPELKSLIIAAQGSLRNSFSELESAADSAMVTAREVLESATLQANRTVLDLQIPLMDLLESITTTIVTAVSKARQFSTNITSCISGQEEEARSVVKETGKVNSKLRHGTVLSRLQKEFISYKTLEPG
jgi:hypothetical protein